VRWGRRWGEAETWRMCAMKASVMRRSSFPPMSAYSAALRLPPSRAQRVVTLLCRQSARTPAPASFCRQFCPRRRVGQAAVFRRLVFHGLPSFPWR